MSDGHHAPQLPPLGNPWPSVVAAFAIAALIAAGAAWRAQRALGAEHGASAYHEVDAGLATAGWLSHAAPAELKAAGFEVVIDLRTAKEQGVAAEREAVEAAGLRYINSPVSGPPSREQFAAFSAALAAERPHKVLVHCATNKRASTMVMLHRITRERVAPAEARRDLEAVWTPNPRYEAFIAGVIADPPPAAEPATQK
jgi:uncharacterized protein (TIGR01244 family)